MVCLVSEQDRQESRRTTPSYFGNAPVSKSVQGLEDAAESLLAQP